MARAPKTKPGTEIVDWEKQMEEQAAIAAAAQRSTGGGGKFFSLQAGVLSYDGNPMPGNRMAVIILADTMENSYYDVPYDPSTPAAPRCFAFAKDEDELEPHEAVDKEAYFERQHDQCDGCPQNEWGSARTGKGKACSNVMRLAMIPAGNYVNTGTARAPVWGLEMITDLDHYAKADVAYMKLPVMSVKNYSTFVKQAAAELRRPPHGLVVDVYTLPDQKSQFRVHFEVVDKLPNDILSVIMPRHTTEQANIGFAYNPPQEDEAPVPQKANSKLAKRPAAKARR